MTLPQAHDTARNAAERFGKAFKVYRLPAWPPAVYGATSLDLPSEASVLATYPLTQFPTQKSEVPASTPQGSLF